MLLYNGRRETVEGPSKDRRGITNLWIENQQLAVCMTRLRNALVFRRYVVATKKAHSGMPSAWPTTHEDGRRNS